MINKIVYFVPFPLYLRDYDRFGAEIFIKNGFDVIFFNFTPFLYPLLYNEGPSKNRYNGDKQKLFFSEADALNEISKLTKNCFVVSLAHYGYNTFRIYRKLSKVGAPYSNSVLNCIPTFPVKSSSVDRIINRIRKIKLSRLSVILKNYLFQPRYAPYMGIREPALLLAGGKKSISHSLTSLCGKNTETLWAHTYDYDIYLENKNKSSSVDSCNKAVFIDAPSPRFAHNTLIPGISNPLTEEKYYPSLCKFFDRLEKELNVKVEIAAHPASDHETYPDYFGNRLTLSGKTCEQIMRSKIVINRDSTAINYAVLANKPVVFITSVETEEHSDNYLYGSIRAMASWLGKKPLNIDGNPNDWDLEKELSIDRSAYTNYKESYIKYKGPEDLKTWQIVADRLKEL